MDFELTSLYETKSRKHGRSPEARQAVRGLFGRQAVHKDSFGERVTLNEVEARKFYFRF